MYLLFSNMFYLRNAYADRVNLLFIYLNATISGNDKGTALKCNYHLYLVIIYISSWVKGNVQSKN